MPDDLEQAKAYAYALYHAIADGKINLGLICVISGHRDFERAIPALNRTFEEFLLEMLNDMLEHGKAEENASEGSRQLGNRIFIIHGHDEGLRKSVQLFLTTAGLDGIVLHEQPDKGRTVIEKLEEETSDACFAIALLSPDDVMAEGTSRARQNVILEVGYFLGKLGRDRVRLLKRGEVEIPSDLSGILYVQYDQNGAWRVKLLKEMREAGVEGIDLERIIRSF